jgi:hypothetical protein
MPTENNHEDIVKTTEKPKENQKEMTSMLQEMYLMMKVNSGGLSN